MIDRLVDRGRFFFFSLCELFDYLRPRVPKEKPARKRGYLNLSSLSLPPQLPPFNNPFFLPSSSTITDFSSTVSTLPPLSTYYRLSLSWLDAFHSARLLDCYVTPSRPLPNLQDSAPDNKEQWRVDLTTRRAFQNPAHRLHRGRNDNLRVSHSQH
mgnify:CR=1 FL=1